MPGAARRRQGQATAPTGRAAQRRGHGTAEARGGAAADVESARRTHRRGREESHQGSFIFISVISADKCYLPAVVLLMNELSFV